MTPRAALLDLVARVGARDGAAVRVSETDVRQWPAEAVAALKAHRFLVRARPATTVVCPGCEADCVMPVQTIPAGPRAAARFIVCDKRSDINRVALTTAHVDQWKCDGEALARFVVAQLGLRRSRHRIDDSGTRPLGLAAGDTRHQMLGLRTHGDVTLVVADTAVALADLIDFDRGAYRLDTAAIRHLVDAATTADPRWLEARFLRAVESATARDIEAFHIEQHHALSTLHRIDTSGAHPLGDLPLVVLARGEGNNDRQMALQIDLARLSRNSRLTVVEDSGHEIHLFRPDMVVAAIRAVSEAGVDGAELRRNDSDRRP